MHTSFSDNAVLGKFDDNCATIGTRLDQANVQSEELRAAYERIKMLEADLLECREYLEDHVDVNDGDEGPVPNRAMALVSMIDESLHGPGGF